jgi:quinol monooxygenase YgiN
VVMHARSTTFTDRPGAIDAGIAMVRDEVLPAVQEMDGCIGMSMLVSRDTGGCVITSAWRDREAMRASASSVAPLRERAERLFGGRPEVREWEVAVLHRVRPTVDGSCARVTWTQVDPALVEAQLETFRAGVLPRIDDLPGFCSVSLMVDRDTGRSALATVYENARALERSREEAADLRTAVTREMRMELLDVAEFEVALAHLRVPETV